MIDFGPEHTSSPGVRASSSRSALTSGSRRDARPRCRRSHRRRSPAFAAAQIVALTVVAPARPRATATGMSRRATFVAVPRSAKRRDRRPRADHYAPSTTPIHAGRHRPTGSPRSSARRTPRCAEPAGPDRSRWSRARPRRGRAQRVVDLARHRRARRHHALPRATRRGWPRRAPRPGTRGERIVGLGAPASDASSTPSKASPAPVGSTSSIGSVGVRSARRRRDDRPAFAQLHRRQAVALAERRAASSPSRPVSAAPPGSFANTASPTRTPRRTGPRRTPRPAARTPPRPRPRARSPVRARRLAASWPACSRRYRRPARRPPRSSGQIAGREAGVRSTVGDHRTLPRFVEHEHRAGGARDRP